jgi:hypothetical protein
MIRQTAPQNHSVPMPLVHVIARLDILGMLLSKLQGSFWVTLQIHAHSIQINDGKDPVPDTENQMIWTKRLILRCLIEGQAIIA